MGLVWVYVSPNTINRMITVMLMQSVLLQEVGTNF
jgi:hypothetical protein